MKVFWKIWVGACVYELHLHECLFDDHGEGANFIVLLSDVPYSGLGYGPIPSDSHLEIPPHILDQTKGQLMLAHKCTSENYSITKRQSPSSGSILVFQTVAYA